MKQFIAGDYTLARVDIHENRIRFSSHSDLFNIDIEQKFFVTFSIEMILELERPEPAKLHPPWADFRKKKSEENQLI